MIGISRPVYDVVEAPCFDRTRGRSHQSKRDLGRRYFGALFGEAGANAFAFASVAKTSKVETRRGLANDQTVEHG